MNKQPLKIQPCRTFDRSRFAPSESTMVYSTQTIRGKSGSRATRTWKIPRRTPLSSAERSSTFVPCWNHQGTGAGLRLVSPVESAPWTWMFAWRDERCEMLHPSHIRLYSEDEHPKTFVKLLDLVDHAWNPSGVVLWICFFGRQV